MTIHRGKWKWILTGAFVVVVIYFSWPRLLAEYYYLTIVREPNVDNGSDVDNWVSAWNGLEFLGSYGRPMLLRLLKDKDRLNRAFAAERLHSGGDDVLFGLMEAARNDPDEEVQRAAIASLGSLGDARALPLLKELTKTNHTWRAQSAMASLGEPGITALLEDYRLENDPKKKARRLGMLCGSRSIRKPRVQKAIMAAMSGESWELRATFAACVKEMLGQDSVIYLERLLDDPKPDVRITAAVKLGELGSSSGLGAMKQLILDKSNDEKLRAAAADAMRRPKDLSVAEFLRDVVRTDPSLLVRRSAARALWMLFIYSGGDPEYPTYKDRLSPQ